MGMSNKPLIVIDVDGAKTIGELLPSEESRDRLLRDIFRGHGPDDEPTDDGDRWDGQE